MKESVALAKDADANKEFSSTRSDNSIHRVRNEPERQLGSLRSLIGNIRHDGGTPSLDSIATELSSMHTAQRASVLLALQRTHGNQYVQRVVVGIQAKLKVGLPGDIYEQEADRVADEVMQRKGAEFSHLKDEEERKLIQSKAISGMSSVEIQRQVKEGKEKVEEVVAEEEGEKKQEVDLEIEALDLAPDAKKAAYELKKKHPDIKFTSGRRSVTEQARGMAKNIVQSGDREWIKKTYSDTSSRRKLQKWVDDHPEATTGDAIAKGLEEIFNTLSDRQKGYISKHLAGEAFDVKPQTENAGQIKRDIRALSGLKKFLEREAGLVRWHAQFKKISNTYKTIDKYEQEAERVAQQVVQSQVSNNPQPRIPHGLGLAIVGQPIVNGMFLYRNGRPLDDSLRTFFEPRFGYDFTNVRIHTDTQAAETARALKARAFTEGRDIVFGAGQYAPGTTEGQRLLAHELTHVVQQQSKIRKAPLKVGALAEISDDPLETEASTAGQKVVVGERAFIRNLSFAPSIRLQPKKREPFITVGPIKITEEMEETKFLRDPKVKKKIRNLVADTPYGIDWYKKKGEEDGPEYLISQVIGERYKKKSYAIVKTGTKCGPTNTFIWYDGSVVYYLYNNPERGPEIRKMGAGTWVQNCPVIQRVIEKVYKSVKVWPTIFGYEILVIMVIVKPTILIDVAGNIMEGKSVIDENAMRGYLVGEIFGPLEKFKKVARVGKFLSKKDKVINIFIDTAKAGAESAFEQILKKGKLNADELTEDILKKVLSSQIGKYIAKLPEAKETEKFLEAWASGLLAKELSALESAAKEAIK
jgi:hypothetical protein